MRRAKNDACEKGCEAFLQLADNDLCFMSELRFKMGDKVKAHYDAEGNYVNGNIIKQWEEGEAYCLSWRTTSDRMCGHKVIQMIT